MLTNGSVVCRYRIERVLGTGKRAVRIVAQVAKALDFAHAIGPDERVLLDDFGIAHAFDDVGPTATGSVMVAVPARYTIKTAARQLDSAQHQMAAQNRILTERH